MKFLEKLSETKLIRASFVTTLILTLVFGIVMHTWQFKIIDEMYDAQKIVEHILMLTDLQRQVHIWLTATVDVIYPFAYAAFFIGVTVRSFKKYALILCFPSFLVVPVDLLEGFAQVMLLNGGNQFMPLKVMMTPIKKVLFLISVVITLVGLLKLAVSKRRQNYKI